MSFADIEAKQMTRDVKQARKKQLKQEKLVTAKQKAMKAQKKIVPEDIPR